MNVLIIALYPVALAIGWLIGTYAWRLFPKYRRGAHVLVDYGDGYPIRCEYLYRSVGPFHKARVLPGNDLGWSGRILTTKTRELTSA